MLKSCGECLQCLLLFLSCVSEGLALGYAMLAQCTDPPPPPPPTWKVLETRLSCAAQNSIFPLPRAEVAAPEAERLPPILLQIDPSDDADRKLNEEAKSAFQANPPDPPGMFKDRYYRKAEEHC